MLRKILLWFKYRTIKFKFIGKNSNYKGFFSTFIKPENIYIGNNVWLGKNIEIDATGGVSIGDSSILAQNICIMTRTHNYNSDDLEALPFDNIMLISSVIIEEYVWIGRNVSILPGVRIGKGAVIGAFSVVSKDVPDYAVVVGNPAKVVKYRNKERFELLENEKSFVYTKYKHNKINREKNAKQ